MNSVLLKSLVALVPAGMLFVGAAVLAIRLRRLALMAQLVGATGLVVVVATHICEALRLFPSMRWGSEHSLGHYLDLGSAAGGSALFALGYLVHALALRKA